MSPICKLSVTDLSCMFDVGRFSLIKKDSAISRFQELLLKFLDIILKSSQLTFACPDSTECFKICDFKSLPLWSFMRSEVLRPLSPM